MITAGATPTPKTIDQRRVALTSPQVKTLQTDNAGTLTPDRVTRADILRSGNLRGHPGQRSGVASDRTGRRDATCDVQQRLLARPRQSGRCSPAARRAVVPHGELRDQPGWGIQGPLTPHRPENSNPSRFPDRCRGVGAADRLDTHLGRQVDLTRAGPHGDLREGDAGPAAATTPWQLRDQ